MLSVFLKNQSILKKFLFTNFLVFVVIGILTLVYLNNIQPSLIKNKTSNHIKTLNNTIENLNRLKIKFNEEDVRKFLFSTRFLFQNLDRVQIFDKTFNLIGDTDTLDLDPRAFSQKLDAVEMNDLNIEQVKKEEKNNIKKNNKSLLMLSKLENYSNSEEFGKPYTFTLESYDQFLLVTIKNVISNNKNIGYLAISESANDIKAAIDERKNFIIRTVLAVALVILIFSLFLNKYI